MATSAVSSTSGSNNAVISSINGTSTTKTTTADEMQTRFLNLLITQLKNQDPLNPTDANQMTSQLSQISTVSGIEKLNATMDKLMGSYSDTQSMQAASMIGKTVLTAGNGLELGTKGAIGGVNLAGSADKLTITIRDSAGKVVQTQKMEDVPAGTFNFYWDGKSDAGTAAAEGGYTFSVEAVQGETKVDATALQAGMVSAVTLAKGGATLQLSDNKTVAYSDILQILN